MGLRTRVGIDANKANNTAVALIVKNRYLGLPLPDGRIVRAYENRQMLHCIWNFDSLDPPSVVHLDGKRHGPGHHQNQILDPKGNFFYEQLGKGATEDV